MLRPYQSSDLYQFPKVRLQILVGAYSRMPLQMTVGRAIFWNWYYLSPIPKGKAPNCYCRQRTRLKPSLPLASQSEPNYGRLALS